MTANASESARREEALEVAATTSLLRAAIPFFCVLVVYQVTRYFYDAAQLGSGIANGTIDGSVGLTQTLPSKLIWTSAAAVYTLVWIGATGAILLEIWKIVAEESRSVRFGAVTTATAAVAAGLLSGAENPLTIPPMRSLLDASFTVHQIAAGDLLLGVFNGFWISTVLLMTAAIACVLAFPLSGPRGAAHFRERFGALNRVLYAAAGVLVAGVLQSHLMHDLPSSLLGEGAESYRNLARAVSVSNGTLWTLLLLGLYIPAAVLLRGQTLRLATRVVGAAMGEKLEEWLRDQGMAFSPTEQLSRIVALLSPLLAGGPLIQVLELVVG